MELQSSSISQKHGEKKTFKQKMQYNEWNKYLEIPNPFQCPYSRVGFPQLIRTYSSIK